jgi:ABC-type glycerol-3-phosphate transport system substrate-binding protein
MSARRRVRGAVLLGALVVLALLATACAGESADDAADEDAESTTSTVAVVDPTEEYAAMKASFKAPAYTG